MSSLRRGSALAAVTLLPLAAAACGSSGSGVQAPTIQAARTFQLAGFKPAGKIVAGKPTKLSFRIDQPSGATLTAYERGAGPHTGIHLIIVRDDLGTILHRHPPVAKDGTLTETVVFPTAGRYRMVVDAYPNLGGQLPNFQLFRWLDVSGKSSPPAKISFPSTVTTDGYRITLHGHPKVRAIQPALLKVTVQDPQGRPARFTQWYGALAHAIFFRKGTLDYFHTHVCAPGATGCASVLGPSKVTGSSATPGKLTVGVLVPVPGIWRLFLQAKVNGHILTAPFAFRVT